MNKLFLFAIGGTGSRVLKALTHLLAAGVKINATEIIPVIIDPDQAAGNKDEVLTLMDQYRTVRSALSPTDASTTFFRPPLNPLPKGYMMNVCTDIAKSFSDYMDFSTLDDENRAMADMLYSEKEQNANMNVGFKGCPNMGCVVLNQFLLNPSFSDFANRFNAGDGIFIISSIFGGTGASGFPLLLKTLRDPMPGLHAADAIKNAPVGGVTVFPYFKLTAEKSADINSDTFISKMKAALSYYKRNLNGLDALYYVGDAMNQIYRNVSGGKGQRNTAHFVELISALAILDFAATGTHGGATQYKEFSIPQDKDPVTLPDLQRQTYDLLARPMTEFALFSKFMMYELEAAKSQTWFSKNKPDFAKILGGDFFKALSAFCAAHLNWLDEMEKNSRSFSPFVLENVASDVYGFAKDIPTQRVFSSKSNWALYETYLNDVNKSKALTRQANSAEGCFVAVACEANRKVVNGKIKL